MTRAVPLLIVAALLAGCMPKNQPTSRVYRGPTEPMRQVIAAVNDNNAQLPTLWSRGYFEANVVDRGRSNFINGDLLLLYRRADELRLVGKKDIAGSVFEIGSNAERYWLIVRGDTDTMWWGRHGSTSSGDTKDIPIQPELMLEVLGIGAIATNLREPPVPVMRFNNDADAYMIVWNVPLSDRWAAQKEVWFDRKSKLPVKVLLFDENGRVLLRADLSNHQPVQTPGAPRERWPNVATAYRLYFPDSGTTVTLELQSPALGNAGAPNDRSFAFPVDNGGVNHVIQVDEHAATQR